MIFVLGVLWASLDRVVSESDKLLKKLMTRNELKPHLSIILSTCWFLAYALLLLVYMLFS